MTASRLRLALQVVPNASKSEVAGAAEGALRIRLQAQPIEGRANEELVRLLARLLGLPKSAIAVVQGQASRCKLVEIRCPEGMDEDSVRRSLLGDAA